jgi:hypothetical protein
MYSINFRLFPANSRLSIFFDCSGAGEAMQYCSDLSGPSRARETRQKGYAKCGWIPRSPDFC